MLEFLWGIFVLILLINFFKDKFSNTNKKDNKPWIFSSRHDQIQWNINHPADPVDVSDE